MQYGEIYARSQSNIGQHVLLCAQRYHRSISDVIYIPAHSFTNAFAYNSVDFETHMAAKPAYRDTNVKRPCIILSQLFLDV